MPRNARAAWWATVVLFLVHGLVISTWISRIPAVAASLQLNNAVLGLTLLSAAVGAMCCIPIAGWLVGRFGSKQICIITSIMLCLALILLGLAGSAFDLAAGLFVFGGVAASMGVAMNAQGVEVEKEMRRPTMSRFHGMFSLGGMLGAAAGGAAAAHGTLPHFAVSAAINTMAVFAVSSLLLNSSAAPIETAHRLPFRQIRGTLLALSAIGFCILLSEGAMADWTTLYLRQVLRAGPGGAAFGYSVFSAAMAGMRFLGDAVTARIGPLRAVRSGSLIAAVGLAWALLMQNADWALPGFGVVGCGFAVIIPLIFGSAGRVEGVSHSTGIATVSGIGYLGFIAGPPAIGFLSQLFTLRYALSLVILCCLISALLARVALGGRPQVVSAR